MPNKNGEVINRSKILAVVLTTIVGILLLTITSWPARPSSVEAQSGGFLGCSGGGSADIELAEIIANKTKWGLGGTPPSYPPSRDFDFPPGQVLGAGRYKVYAKAADDHFLFRRTDTSKVYNHWPWWDDVVADVVPPGTHGTYESTGGSHNQQTEQIYIQLDTSDASTITPWATPDYGLAVPYVASDVLRDFNDLYDYVGGGYERNGTPITSGVAKRGMVDVGGGNLQEVAFYQDNDLDWDLSDPTGGVPDLVLRDRGFYLGEVMLNRDVTSIRFLHHSAVHTGPGETGNGTQSIQPLSVFLECTSPGTVSDFQLTPLITGPTTAFPGQNVTFNYQVTTNEDTGIDIDIDMTRSGGAPGNPFGTGSFTQPIQQSSGWTSSVTNPIPIDAAPGTSWCGQLTVNPGGATSGVLDPPKTDSHCLTVQVNPYLSIKNASITAGACFAQATPAPPALPGQCEVADKNTRRDILSITKLISGQWYGTAVEYAALATGDVTNVGSHQIGNSTIANDTTLTFANTPGLGRFHGENTEFANYYDDLEPQATLNADVTSNVLQPVTGWPTNATITTAGDGLYKHTGNLTIDNTFNQPGGFDIPHGINTVLVVDGDVTIDSNITYQPDPYADLDAIPSFVLVVRGDINIKPGVTRLDGLYVAVKTTGISNGHINTCDTITPTTCNNQLVINGGFIAQKVDFLRTFGGISYSTNAGAALSQCPGGNTTYNDNSRCAAELFDFSPELYLADIASLSQSSGASFGNIDSFRDLPPVVD